MDWNKVCRIGIDKVVLNQFEINKLDNFNITASDIVEGKIEKFWIKHELCDIELKKIFKENGEKSSNKISFNPNKILFGNNITNAREDELLTSILILDEMLKNDFGLEVDFFNAKIQEVEINNNLIIENDDYGMIFNAVQDGHDVKYEEQIKAGKIKSSKAYTERDTGTRGDKKNNFWIYRKNFTLRTYNKTKRVNDPSLLKENVTRFEVTLKKAYKDNLIKFKIENSLRSLFENFWMIDDMYMFYIEKYIFSLILFEIDRYKKNAEIEYIRYKKFGKNQEIKSNVRSVFESLEKHNFVFDYIFIIDLIDKYDKKHKGRETERATKTLSKFKELTKLNFLVEYFFAPQSPKCGDKTKLQIELLKLRTKELERLLLEKK